MSRILKNCLYYFCNSILPLLFSIITFPILTKYLTTSDYGIIGIITTYSSIISLIITLQLASAVPRFKHDYDSLELTKFFSTVLIYLVFVTIFTLIILFYFKADICSLLNLSDHHNIDKYFAIGLTTMMITKLTASCNYLLIAFEEGSKIFIRGLITLPINLILTILFVAFFKMGLVGALYSTLITSIIILIINLLLVRKYITIHFDRKYFLESFKYSLPIVPHSLGGFLFMSSYIIILEKFVTTSIIGLYVLANKFARIFENLMVSINNAFLPTFYKLSKTDKQHTAQLFKEIYNILLFFKIFIASIFIFLFQPILSFFVDEEYWGATDYFYILLYAFVFRGLYHFSNHALFLNKRTGLVCIATISTGIINLILNLYFVPLHGATAAAYTTLFCNLLVVYICFVLMKINNYVFKLKYSLQLFLFFLTFF